MKQFLCGNLGFLIRAFFCLFFCPFYASLSKLTPSRFYAKILPLLKAKNISYATRREWPEDIMKRVFQELSIETPTNLFAKELWCSSSTVTQWWIKTQVRWEGRRWEGGMAGEREGMVGKRRRDGDDERIHDLLGS
jgi:hypothetical protein